MEDPELCDTVILQPEWVNGYISKVLDSPEVEASQGLLTRTHLRQLWRGLDRGTSDHFLSMMDKYDLSYRVDGRTDDVSLVVERLSWNPPAYQDVWRGMAGKQEIRVLYRLNTMPPGIPTWFIARSHTIECHRSGDDVDIRSLLLGLAPSSRDATVMSLDQIDRRLIRIESKVDENAEYNQRMFMRLQHIAQTQQETRCPSVFALVQLKKRNFELHLYCEEPGAWHRLPEPEGVYAIKQPYEWVRKFGPHLQRVLKVLKYTAPLAGPVLGITVDQLSQQLKADCDLMKELVSRAPETFRTEAHAGDDIPSVRAEHDADFRALEAMLLELDEKRVWGGLSRTTTPEGLTLYLCSEHRKAY